LAVGVKYRALIARKWNYSDRRGPGRPRTRAEKAGGYKLVARNKTNLGCELMQAAGPREWRSTTVALRARKLLS
jgi:hypothetical protein